MLGKWNRFLKAGPRRCDIQKTNFSLKSLSLIKSINLMPSHSAFASLLFAQKQHGLFLKDVSSLKMLKCYYWV